MKKKYLLAAALISTWALSAKAAERRLAAKIVSDKIDLKPGEALRIVMDRGEIALMPDGETSYRVEFLPDAGSKPTQKDFDDCAVSYDAQSGLSIRAGEHISSLVKVGLPATQPLAARLSAGVARIGPFTGKVDVAMKTGILEYDASALPKNKCVAATVNVGVVNNERDFDCKNGNTTFHVRTGTITVK